MPTVFENLAIWNWNLQKKPIPMGLPCENLKKVYNLSCLITNYTSKAHTNAACFLLSTEGQKAPCEAWSFCTFSSWCLTSVLSPPKSCFPQDTTVPSCRSAAKAPLVDLGTDYSAGIEVFAKVRWKNNTHEQLVKNMRIAHDSVANVESEPTAAKGANKKLAGMPHPYLRLPCIKTFLKGTVSDKRLYALYTKQLVLDPAAVASIHRITPSHHASIPSNSRESCKCTP